MDAAVRVVEDAVDGVCEMVRCTSTGHNQDTNFGVVHKDIEIIGVPYRKGRCDALTAYNR